MSSANVFSLGIVHEYFSLLLDVITIVSKTFFSGLNIKNGSPFTGRRESEAASFKTESGPEDLKKLYYYQRLV